MSRFNPLPHETHINIAPLVDVMLVLLVIFMVTAPMMTAGVNINLPKTKKAQSIKQAKQNIVISVTKSGRIFIEKKHFSLSTLVLEIDELTGKDKAQIIQVKGDTDLAYGKIFEVMNVLVNHGYQKLSLIAEVKND